jgi:hypothetical protein
MQVLGANNNLLIISPVTHISAFFYAPQKGVESSQAPGFYFKREDGDGTA